MSDQTNESDWSWAEGVPAAAPPPPTEEVPEEAHTQPIAGPPGTGKSTALIEIFIRAAKQSWGGAERVGYLAYTNVAADEAKAKLTRLGLDSSELRNVRTLHSLACALAKVDHTKLMTDDQKTKFREQHFPGLPQSLAKRYEAIVDRARIRGVPRAKLSSCVLPGEVRYVDSARLLRFHDAFTAYLSINRIMTFEDVLRVILASKGTARELIPDIDYLIVDEGQDLNPTAAALIDWWGSRCRRLYVAADDDQCIFTFAGADPTWFQGLFRAHAGKVLEQSYRVPRKAHALAATIIGQVKNRIGSAYLPTSEEGEVIRGVTVAQLPRLLDGKTNLVLARDGWVLKHAKRVLDAAGVPYTESGTAAGGDAELVMLTKVGMGLASGDAIFARELLKLVKRRRRPGDSELMAHLASCAGATVTADELVRLLGQVPLLRELTARQPEALGRLSAYSDDADH